MVHQVSCSDAGYDDCAFLVQSENAEEMIQFVQQHSERTHNQAVTPGDVRGVMRDV